MCSHDWVEPLDSLIMLYTKEFLVPNLTPNFGQKDRVEPHEPLIKLYIHSLPRKSSSRTSPLTDLTPRPLQGGCIIRAAFLDDISKAYVRNPDLPNLLVDPQFASKLATSQAQWRRVIGLAVAAGVPVPGFTASLSYFDTYRRDRLPANLVQAQRDFFGSHTYQRTDADGWFHTVSGATGQGVNNRGYNHCRLGSM